MAGLLSKRLLFVTGKGGVGKSTIAAALGRLAARRGLRTVVADVTGRNQLVRTLSNGHADGSRAIERPLDDCLWTTTIDPQAALEEYLSDQLPLRAMADLLSSSRSFQYLAAATPGLRELLTVGKLWELAQPRRRTPGAHAYDLVVVDAPATGHGIGLLAAPRTFAGAARIGPVARHARIIAATLADPSITGVVVVTRAEEIPITETLALHDELAARLGHHVDCVIANALTPRRYPPREARLLADRLASADDLDPSARAALRAALAEHLRERGERAQLRRLRAGGVREDARLPFLVAHAPIGPAGAERLARALEVAL
jgi:anion-transporting  ArsA/GET3 family ATPase